MLTKKQQELVDTRKTFEEQKEDFKSTKQQLASATAEIEEQKAALA
jgi:hypothetical protein